MLRLIAMAALGAMLAGCTTVPVAGGLAKAGTTCKRKAPAPNEPEPGGSPKADYYRLRGLYGGVASSLDACQAYLGALEKHSGG